VKRQFAEIHRDVLGEIGRPLRGKTRWVTGSIPGINRWLPIRMFRLMPFTGLAKWEIPAGSPALTSGSSRFNPYQDYWAGELNSLQKSVRFSLHPTGRWQRISGAWTVIYAGRVGPR